MKNFASLKTLILVASSSMFVLSTPVYSADNMSTESLVSIETRIMAAETTLQAMTSSLGLPKDHDQHVENTDHSPRIVVAQSRIGELQLRLNTVEQQLRTLTGQMQEMQFQMQQMQQQFQNYAQDSEYRFQQLEGSQGSQLRREQPVTPQQPQENPLPNNLDLPETFQDDGQPLDLRSIFKDSLLDFGIEAPSPNDNERIIEAESLIALGEFNAAKQILTDMVALTDQTDDKIRALDLLGSTHYSLSEYPQATNVWLEGYRLSQQTNHEPKLLIQLATAMSAIGERDSACSMAGKLETDFSANQDADTALYLAESKQLQSRLNCS